MPLVAFNEHKRSGQSLLVFRLFAGRWVAGRALGRETSWIPYLADYVPCLVKQGQNLLCQFHSSLADELPSPSIKAVDREETSKGDGDALGDPGHFIKRHDSPTLQHRGPGSGREQWISLDRRTHAARSSPNQVALPRRKTAWSPHARSGDAPPLVHCHRRAVREKGRGRCTLQERRERSAVELLDVGLEGSADRVRYAPRRVLDLVLDSAAVALARVAPVVLGDEALLRVGRGRR